MGDDEQLARILEDGRRSSKGAGWIMLFVMFLCIGTAVAVTVALAAKQPKVAPAIVVHPDTSREPLVVERIRVIDGVTVVQIHAQALDKTCLFARLKDQLAGPICISDVDRNAL